MANVLVVDDETAVLRIIETVLTQGGHSVVTASNGQKALDKAKHHGPFDLALIDVVMPGIAGPMVADQLVAEYPKLKILFMSGFDDLHVVRRYTTSEGHQLLGKPFRAEELAAKVREVLAPVGGDSPQG